jgi:hypothetical protein
MSDELIRLLGNLGESLALSLAKAREVLAYERRTSSSEEKATIAACLRDARTLLSDVFGTVTFEIKRHNDFDYKPPAPWNKWDAYAGCWVCRSCGAAAGYQIHNSLCGEVRP